MESKEEEIRKKIEEITGRTLERRVLRKQHSLRKNCIKKILLLSSSYDFFLLEEQGRLQRLLKQLQLDEESSEIKLIHAQNYQEARQKTEENQFDLYLLFNPTDESPLYSHLEEIQNNQNTPIVLLANSIKTLQDIKKKDTQKLIKEYFTWNGDGKIITTILQLLEDKNNITQEKIAKNNIILLIEDSIQYYSTILETIYDQLNLFMEDLLKEQLNSFQKQKRFQRRPLVIHASTFQEANTYLESYQKDIICVITDNHSATEGGVNVDSGVDFAIKLSKHNPALPILINSSEPVSNKKKQQNTLQFISKNEPKFKATLKEHIKKSLGSIILILEDENKNKHQLSSIADFEEALPKLSEKTLQKYSKKSSFSKWLWSLREFEYSDQVRTIEQHTNNKTQLKQLLLESLETFHYAVDDELITDYDRSGKRTLGKFSRMGEGALGGKARGLAFLAQLLSKYVPEDVLDDIKITVPRTIVLSTEVFEKFIEKNKLFDSTMLQRTDERIAAKFLSSSLPPIILGDLRSFVRNTKKPLIIRSSGILEDSLHQPFAGIYSSVLLPNESWETDLRFQEVCTAVKYVYSSTYFERAQSYIKSTPKRIGDEKMAVILQEVVGRKHQRYFYPAISGVAKSYNHYPIGSSKPEDGIAYLALGLGKAIVDGGATYCFSPAKPKKPIGGTPKDFISYAQSKFFAVDLNSVYSFGSKEEDSSVVQLGIKSVPKEEVLRHIASTYLPADDALYPGLEEGGLPVVDFSPIILYDSIPLAKALHLLLEISQIALGYPVEIEFALTLPKNDEDTAELVVLQLRSMMRPDEECTINLKTYPEENILCFSDNALGNGIIKDIEDVVYVKPDVFDMANSTRIVDQIRAINTKLLDQHKPYMLIGPGRWGSSDPWLGIPIQWSDIAGVKVIVETPFSERTLEPSQGSHFFHDMVSSQIGYLITKKGSQDVDWAYLNSLEIIEETQDIIHAKAPKNLEVLLEGCSRKALILKS